MGAVGWYCPLILRRRVNPAPATWIIACLAINLSMVAYHAIPGRSLMAKLISNASLYGAALEITIVLIVLVFVLWRANELRIAFDWVQKSCLAVMCLTLLYWYSHHDQARATFWTTQALMIVAYIATISKAIQCRTAFDSIGNWGLIFAACTVGLVAALLMRDLYGIANAARGSIMSVVTLLILVHFDRQAGYTRWRDEVITLRSFYGLK